MLGPFSGDDGKGLTHAGWSRGDKVGTSFWVVPGWGPVHVWLAAEALSMDSDDAHVLFISPPFPRRHLGCAPHCELA